jgi:AraC-like DNA-binding protein
MEAATPLRHPRVTTADRRLTIHDLTVEDEAAARVVREREQAGEEPAKTVADAIEIGARVLDREQAAANAEYVRTEFEKTANEIDRQFSEKARTVAEHFGQKVDEVFGEDSGQLAKEFEKLFSDGSTASVQNRVRELVAETMAKSREDLMRQFSAADGSNPLAEFKEGTVRELQRMAQILTGMHEQVVELRAEKEKLEALEEERERGTAKGRSFEEEVADALDEIADAQGDVAEAVGDLMGATGKTGDVLVDIDACSGPARGRIVFEAKNARLSGPGARQELADALRERDADYAVLVVPGEEKVPARLRPLREIEGDKLIVTYDPEEGSRLVLEVGYRLARARVLMKRADATDVDAGAIREATERALGELDEVRKAKSQLTGAKTGIDHAYKLIEDMAARVRDRLTEIDSLIGAAGTGAQRELDI